ncbi:restriction endonuclease subunit S [Pseudomonas sp. Z3-6]|uniref:hypothetical protein n=1 Tax=Pseudomonas sp. Z3-6 TaxID=2817411 RepID=UPI003DA7C1D7
MTNLAGANLNNGAAVGPQGEGRESPSSFPEYPAYKASGVEWLGEVPEHWTVQPLKRAIAKIESGTSVNAADYPAEPGSYGVLKTSCVYTGQFDWRENKTVDDEDLNRVSCPLKIDTLVVSRMNTPDLVGATGLVTEAPAGIFLPDRLWQVYFEKNQSASFVFYFTKAPEYREQVKNACSGTSSSMQNLGQDDFRTLLFVEPPVAEQTQIARFLDHETARIDALIEEQQRLIELLKEKRQAVISHAVTKGLDPTVPMKDSGAEWLGEVPAHWETLRIGAVYSEAADKGLAELPVLRVSIHHGVSDKELSEEESDRKITRIDDREKYKRVRPGDLVYNMMRAWQGGFGAVLVDGLVSPAYVVARPKNEDISRYVEQLLRTGCAVEEMRKNSYGITDFRLRLYWDQFKNIVIVIPPEVERQQIMERIDSLINESEALKSEADRLIVILQERRSALISAAVTGKIDVRGWQPPARAQAPVLEAEAV